MGGEAPSTERNAARYRAALRSSCCRPSGLAGIAVGRQVVIAGHFGARPIDGRTGSPIPLRPKGVCGGLVGPDRPTLDQLPAANPESQHNVLVQGLAPLALG
jgi:hypothetical protein